MPDTGPTLPTHADLSKEAISLFRLVGLREHYTDLANTLIDLPYNALVDLVQLMRDAHSKMRQIKEQHDGVFPPGR
jgi:hypothetical protein